MFNGATDLDVSNCLETWLIWMLPPIAPSLRQGNKLREQDHISSQQAEMEDSVRITLLSLQWST